MVLTETAERYDMLRLVGAMLCWRAFAEPKKVRDFCLLRIKNYSFDCSNLNNV